MTGKHGLSSTPALEFKSSVTTWLSPTQNVSKPLSRRKLATACCLRSTRSDQSPSPLTLTCWPRRTDGEPWCRIVPERPRIPSSLTWSSVFQPVKSRLELLAAQKDCANTIKSCALKKNSAVPLNSPARSSAIHTLKRAQPTPNATTQKHPKSRKC